MTLILEISILGLLIYLFKTSIIVIGKRRLPLFAERMIALLPVAMLSSLIANLAIDASTKIEPIAYIAGIACVSLAGVITWIRKGITSACLSAMVLLFLLEFFWAGW